ncbi:MAG: DNA polymerase III subunit delta, partial [Acidimicrobiales bacterium]
LRLRPRPDDMTEHDTATIKAAYLITGGDASLVSRALSNLLLELTGPGEEVTEVEEYEVPEGGEGDEDAGFKLAPVLTALSTPPWLSAHRVVVVRNVGEINAAQASELAKALADPETENVLVLAAGGRKGAPASISKAVKANGRVIETEPGRAGRARTDWIAEQLREAPVHLDAHAVRRLSEHVGEDISLLPPILDLLEAAHGPGRKLGVDELEPFLGEQGGAPPWDLTDAIDRGDGDTAIRVLRRLLGPGGRHPLQVLSTLHRHVGGMLRLDGAEGVRRPEDAAALLQMSAFPAKKVLEQSRRLGHDRIERAVEVLAGADKDLRGQIGWPPELILEVAVARLAQLGRSSAAPGPAAPARRR